jgi:hypothetical protein
VEKWSAANVNAVTVSLKLKTNGTPYCDVRYFEVMRSKWMEKLAEVGVVVTDEDGLLRLS